MPLFEDDTLEGAVKKATLGLRKPKYGSFGKNSGLAKRSLSAPKSRIRHRPETFGDRSFGQRIGSGRSGLRNASQTVKLATNEMIGLARSTYPERFEDIRRGERHVMIPALAARILVSNWRDIGSGTESYSYDGLYVGLAHHRGPNRGSGDFNIPGSANIVAVVHAHWADKTASSVDRSKKLSIISDVASERGQGSSRPQISFYVYGIRGGLVTY